MLCPNFEYFSSAFVCNKVPSAMSKFRGRAPCDYIVRGGWCWSFWRFSHICFAFQKTCIVTVARRKHILILLVIQTFFPFASGK